MRVPSMVKLKGLTTRIALWHAALRQRRACHDLNPHLISAEHDGHGAWPIRNPFIGPFCSAMRGARRFGAAGVGAATTSKIPLTTGHRVRWVATSHHTDALYLQC